MYIIFTYIDFVYTLYNLNTILYKILYNFYIHTYIHICVSYILGR